MLIPYIDPVFLTIPRGKAKIIVFMVNSEEKQTLVILTQNFHNLLRYNY